MKASHWLLALVPPVGVGVAFLAAWGWLPAAEARGGDATFWDQAVVDFVRDRVEGSYVDELPREKTAEMFYAALDGYLGVLDPYSSFLSPDEYRRWVEAHSGQYAGIGVRVERAEGGLLLQGVLPGGPADRAGLRIGDVIAAADGRSLAGMDLRDANLRLLKGPEGSSVVLTVRSPVAPGPSPSDEAPPALAPPSRDVTVVRALIQTPTVHARRVGEGGRYGHLRVTEFVSTTSGEFDRHLDRLLADGVRSVVLDLRDNGGGLLDATVRVADRFLRSGDIVRTLGRAPGAMETHSAKDAGTVPESVGLVVLVNARSASASELLAGALQDHRRGVVLGTRTHGKFLVQQIIPLPGKGAAVKLTTSRYVTPMGRWFKRSSRSNDVPEGLLPDLAVALPAEDATRLEKEWVNADDAVWGQGPRYPEVAADWVDAQLERAIDLLDGNLLFPEIRRPSAPSQG